MDTTKVNLYTIKRHKQYNEIACERCVKYFKPHSGRQKRCDGCKAIVRKEMRRIDGLVRYHRIKDTPEYKQRRNQSARIRKAKQSFSDLEQYVNSLGYKLVKRVGK